MYDMAAEDINAGRRKDNRLEAAEQMGNRSLEWIPERKGNLYEQAAEDIWGTRWKDRGSNVEATQLAAEELHKGRFEEIHRLQLLLQYLISGREESLLPFRSQKNGTFSKLCVASIDKSARSYYNHLMVSDD